MLDHAFPELNSEQFVIKKIKDLNIPITAIQHLKLNRQLKAGEIGEERIEEEALDLKDSRKRIGNRRASWIFIGNFDLSPHRETDHESQLLQSLGVFGAEG